MAGTVLRDDLEWLYGGIIRGSRAEKRMSIVFTGGHWGDGVDTILKTLKKHDSFGSFFVTGDYLQQPGHDEHLRRIVDEGHYLGAHGHAHLLYCPWEDRQKTLVTREEFRSDLQKNLEELSEYGRPEEEMRFWIPPYEWYNDDISAWSNEMGMILFNFSPGTLTNADYTEDDAKNFRDNDTIYKSVIDFEAREADGLNGFIMLIHMGTAPGRSKKFYNRMDELMTYLQEKGYSFVDIEALLTTKEKPGGIN